MILPPFLCSTYPVISTSRRNPSFAFAFNSLLRKRRVREDLVFLIFPPTLQNLRQENRVFGRENLSAFHLKDFSFNTRFLANYVVG
jgi:hypothetical protein